MQITKEIPLGPWVKWKFSKDFKICQMNSTYTRLTYEQRYTIETMLRSGHVPTFISKALGRSPSTITREIDRNSTPAGLYRCKYAQMLADENLKEGHYRHVFTTSMEKLIREKLGEHQWSPEQICGWSERQDIDMVSHERIYQFIWQDKANGGQLYLQLRHGSKKYRKRYGSYGKRGNIPNRVSIDERPEEVNSKQRVGDREMDLIVGPGHKGALLTIVERRTGFTLMANTQGKKAKEVARQAINTLAPVQTMGTYHHQRQRKRVRKSMSMWQTNYRPMCSLLTRTPLGKGDSMNTQTNS